MGNLGKVVHRFQDLTSLGEELLSEISEPQRTRGPLHQARTITVLKRLHAAPDHGWREPEPPRSLGEAAGAGYGHEGRKVREICHSILLCNSVP